MAELADREIQPPHQKEIPPLAGEQLTSLLDQIDKDWSVVDEQRLERRYTFKNFEKALEFTVRIGEVADAADHHPEICLSWGYAQVTIWTHSIGGLSEADFVYAAKVDRVYSGEF